MAITKTQKKYALVFAQIAVWAYMFWLGAQESGITPLRFMIGALAVYQLAYSVTRLDGPFDAFAYLRHYTRPYGWIGRGLMCPMCAAFWLAWPVAAGVAPYSSVIDYGILALALAGATIVFTLALDR